MLQIFLHLLASGIAAIAVVGCSHSDLAVEPDKPTYVQPIPKDAGSTGLAAPDALVNVVAYHWKSHTVLDEVAVVLEDPTGKRSSEKGFTSRLLSNGNYQVSVTTPGNNSSKESAIDLKDVLATMKLAIGIESINGTDRNGKAIEISAYQRAAADFNSDGKIDVTDALEILRYSIGLPVSPSARWQYFHDTEGISPGLPPQTELTKNKRSIDVNGLNTIGVAAVLVGDVDGSWRPDQEKARVAPSYFTALVNTLQAADKNASLARWGIVDQSTETIATIISRSYKDGIETVTYSDGSQTQIAAIAAERIFSINGIFGRLAYYFADTPVANAGVDLSVGSGEMVVLDGTASKGFNASELSYNWILISKPITSNAKLSNSTSSKPSFTADVPGEFALSLTVSDGNLTSNSDNITVTVLPNNIATNAIFEKAYTTVPNPSKVLTSLCAPDVRTPALAWQGVALADLNRDGKKDIVIGYHCPSIVGLQAYEGPTPSSLVIYLSQPDGTYIIGNKLLFGSDVVPYGGILQSFVVADFNNDGQPDVGLAVNKEDGRDFPISSWETEQVVLLSQPDGQYSIEKLSPKSASLKVEAVDNDVGGKDFVYQTSYNSEAIAYRWTTTGWKLISGYPKVNPGMTFFPRPDSRGESNKVITLSTNSSDGGASQEVQEKKSGLWSTTSRYAYPNYQMSEITWSGALYTNSNYVSVNGRKFTYGMIEFSCLLRMNPLKNIEFIISKIGGGLLPSDWDGTSIIYSQKLTPYTTLIPFKLDPSISPYYPLFDIAPSHNNNIRHECKDINNDGYDDVVVNKVGHSPNVRDGAPEFYINNKSGTLIKSPILDLPDAPPQDWGSVGSIVEDMDGDGIPDLIYYGDGFRPSDLFGAFRIHKGKKFFGQ